nr:hypothetical protein [Chitinophagaceae bacterium]
GYAWYKNGLIPEQPGLKDDFLPDMVKIGHTKGIKVFGYFCVGANTKWGLDHPDMSYGTPSAPHIPLTVQYLDYLCASIKDAIIKTGIDGVMLDWVWTPSGEKEPYKAMRWLPCEQLMYNELFGQPFPGKEAINAYQEGQFGARSIARCWSRIYEVVKKTKPSCIIWITCNNVTSKGVAASEMFRQADWLMNEAGDRASTSAMKNMVGKHTKLITCLAEWNGQNPDDIVPAAIRDNIALYGFTKPIVGFAMPPVSMYLSHDINSFRKDSRNIATLARAFNGLPLNSIRKAGH